MPYYIINFEKNDKNNAVNRNKSYFVKKYMLFVDKTEQKL